MEQVALNAMLFFLGRVLGGDVFEKLEKAVVDFFDEACDDMPGAEKFEAVFAMIGPMVSGALVFFVKAAIEMLYVKYSPKLPDLK